MPIDSTYEASELDKLMSALVTWKDELKTRTGWQDSMTSVCMRLAIELNSREAYTHYVMRTEP